MPIARKRVVKHNPAEANTRNNMRCITIKRRSKRVLSRIQSVLSVRSVQSGHKRIEFRSWQLWKNGNEENANGASLRQSLTVSCCNWSWLSETVQVDVNKSSHSLQYSLLVKEPQTRDNTLVTIRISILVTKRTFFPLPLHPDQAPCSHVGEILFQMQACVSVKASGMFHESGHFGLGIGRPQSFQTLKYTMTAVSLFFSVLLSLI
jgi:hypothetical protein